MSEHAVLGRVGTTRIIGLPTLLRTLVFVCFAVMVGTGCAGSQPQLLASAPATLEPAQTIPRDLDFVVRADLRRLRAAIPGPIFDVLSSLVLEHFHLQEFREPFQQAQVVWLGLRPNPEIDATRGVESDYVLVMVGEFSPVQEQAWTAAFFTPRDLGGSYFRYEARDDTRRFHAARVYEAVGQRMIIASAVEVDAVERLIEQQDLPLRQSVPTERGAISLSAEPLHLARAIEERLPRAASFFAESTEMTCFVDLTAEQVEVNFSLRFLTESDALRAEQALSIVAGAVSDVVKLDEALKYKATSDTLRVTVQLGLKDAMSWLGM